MSNTAAGVLRITNNLSQASFTVSGPVSFSAQGNSYIETNAPPGQYTVSWAPVAYWQTPNTQSNVLVAPGTTVFTGNYTLTDVNNNGMQQSLIMNVTNRKVEGKESVTTPAGTWECFKITSKNKINMKMGPIGVPMNIDNTEWFAPGFGVVKTESKHGSTVITSVK